MITDSRTYLVCFFLCLPLAATAQIDTTRTDSVGIRPGNFAPMSDSVAADSAAEDSVELFRVFPWKYHAPINAETVSTDSTLRWQNWPDWSYKKNRDLGVISYRLGTIERSNSYLLNAQEPRYLILQWEDITLNDPVSGTAHWNLIPLHKVKSVYERDEGLYHTTNYYLRHYYLNSPLTKLNYDESKFDYRSLEFTVSQNFSQQTNAEVSYWDRRGGGEYNNSNVAGRQIFARIFHQLDHRQALKLGYINTRYTVGEPFGYAVSNPATFSFDRFTALPNQSNAESVLKSSLLSLRYYRRSADTTEVWDDLHAGIFLNNQGRELTYSSDSTSYEVRSYGANVKKWFDLNFLELEGGASYELSSVKNPQSSNITRDKWGLLRAEGAAVLEPLDAIIFTGSASYHRRSDGFDDYRMGVGAELRIGRFIQLSGKITKGTLMPTPQQLYWSSVEYEGNPSLQNEEISEMSAEISILPLESLELGIQGQLKEIDNGIMVRADSVFGNITPYRSLSATPYITLNSRLFEITGSATYHRFENTGPLGVLDENERVWLKGSAYIKGYLFDRATFVKAGFAGMFSPFRYRPANYNPVLDYWQPLNSDSFLPSFERLDLDISARIRKIMVVLRWENILDDVTQLGYFETAGYPMSQRRFIFGLRVFFRN